MLSADRNSKRDENYYKTTTLPLNNYYIKLRSLFFIDYSGHVSLQAPVYSNKSKDVECMYVCFMQPTHK